MRFPRLLSMRFVAVVSQAALTSACNAPSPSPSAEQGVAPPDGRKAAAAARPAAADAPKGDACGDDHAGSACGDAACGDAASACGNTASACGDEAVPGDAAAPALRRVAASQVCMRTNRFLGRQQLTTEVEGHAYFGCCAGCTRQLTENPAVRTAKDPVTGHAVDKSAAVIGARPDGTVVYFESEETYSRAGGA